MHVELRALVMVGVVGAASASCFSASSHPAVSANPAEVPPPVITCDQIILRPTSPFAGGYRRVLGVISVPPAYIPQVVRNPEGGHFPYFQKAGLVVRANRSPVTVTVPPAWRTRAAITWGNGKPAVSSLEIAACPSPPNVWNTYAGGFALSSHGACVPLLFQIGQRKQLVRFGIDRRCR